MPGLFLYILLVSLAQAYPNRVPAGNAGVPGENTPPCTSCHTVTLNSSNGSVALTFADGFQYRPGQAQRVTVRITDSDTSRVFGFQAAARTSANAQAGSFTAGTGTTVTTQGSLIYINHAASSSSYTFTWTPPAAASGTLRFYVAGMAARSSRDSRVYTAVQDLTPAGTGPTLRSEKPVVLAAGFQPVISSGAWIAIFGENLAPTTRLWNAETEVVDGVLPRSLDGVSVTVNGKAAVVEYISPTQVNAQAPDDDATGPVEVKLTTKEGSATATVQRARYAPGLFDTGTMAARVGDVISLFGTGFGETSPAVAAGVVVTAPVALDDLSQLHVRIGGVEAEVLWAGLISAGLYQINVEVPAVAAGNQPVIAERSGYTSQSGVMLAIVP
ncbi:MAG: choice-of-anchor V domain-containing protein [Bryobacteraceae bacterium]